MSNHPLFESFTGFAQRHIGPRELDIQQMLSDLGLSSLRELTDQTLPKTIRLSENLKLPAPLTEREALEDLRSKISQNRIYRSYIGMGYSDVVLPAVIQRMILENPGWYTQYTPYQAEISQGRLESLLNFQTLVTDLTGLDVANASLLDEATAAAEAMTMAFQARKNQEWDIFLVSDKCHPQTIDVIQTRAQPLEIRVQVVNLESSIDTVSGAFGVLVQYPATDGVLYDYSQLVQKTQAQGALVIFVSDLMALTVVKSPGEWGADVAVGSAQRFGVPMGYGGPSAAYFATREAHKRRMPGRIVGISRDAEGRPAIRLALQTREQHIRRDKATSNICTAQVLLANMAAMYAVYHGPAGLKNIGMRIHQMTVLLASMLEEAGFQLKQAAFFDTIRVTLGQGTAREVQTRCEEKKINVRIVDAKTVSISLDEATTVADVQDLYWVISSKAGPAHGADLPETKKIRLGAHRRMSDYLAHPIFNRYHSETELLRYIKRLESRDLSLTTAMIPLGSCTMKLNAAAEMFPVSWPEISKLHPFVPLEQAAGYSQMMSELEAMLAEVTGYDAVSLQPNAGSQGEYAGLLVIRRYHTDRGQSMRKTCLIPRSAHGTNPASAAMAGMRVVVVECDRNGNVDLVDLESKAREHAKELAAIMVTYPSTHGVFETGITQLCEIVHRHGGQVYLDGANLNAQMGLCRPGDFGADVSHLNLHKTFCIPHGGGGPGVGPIAVKKHLAPYLPGHSVISMANPKAIGAVSAAPWGSASILPISWMYIRMMGADGLKKSAQVAILNANYIAKKLETHYPVLYKGEFGRVAHECILDLRPLKISSGVEVEDVAKRLMDYGFHAPTVSFPVVGTLMIEPTESESKAELDRFCEAMIYIRREIAEIEAGKIRIEDSVLRHAPHTQRVVVSDRWNRKYGRETAAFPVSSLREEKFWPAASRVDGVYGDRNLICSCSSLQVDAQ